MDLKTRLENYNHLGKMKIPSHNYNSLISTIGGSMKTALSDPLMLKKDDVN